MPPNPDHVVQMIGDVCKCCCLPCRVCGSFFSICSRVSLLAKPRSQAHRQHTRPVPDINCNITEEEIPHPATALAEHRKPPSAALNPSPSLPSAAALRSMPPLPHEGSGYLPDTNCNGACYHNAKAEEEPHRPRCGDAGGVVPNGCAGSGARSAEEEVDEGEWEVGAEEWRWLRRCVKAAGKGFAIGAGLKGGLALFGILAGMRRRRRKQGPRKVGVLSNEEALAIALKETLRYGLFLGTFAGTFVSVDECIAAVGGRKKTSRWRSLFAGAVAGPSMLLTGPGTQHTSLAVYILMRAAVLASRCGIKSKRFGNVCKPLTWSYGDIFLMCLSSSQILSAYILKQDSLPSTYRSFLNKHGGKDAVILEGVKNIASGLPFNNLEGIEGYYKSTGVDIKLDPNMKVPCSIIHGHQSCAGHLLSFFLQAYGRALPVYIPVYLIPALIVHREDLLKRPNMILWKNLIGTARSSLFLSAYCSSAWMWTCFFFRIFKRCNIPMVAMGTFPTGLALAIEKKSRRIEISLYCLARAIESFFTCLSDAGYCPQAAQLKRADVVVFSVSTAIIMHCYSQERDVFRSKYLNVLDWVFGVPPQENSNFQSNGCFNCVEDMDTSTRESLQGESCSFYDTPNYLEDMNGYHVKSSTTRNGTCLSNGNLKHVPDSETPP